MQNKILILIVIIIQVYAFDKENVRDTLKIGVVEENEPFYISSSDGFETEIGINLAKYLNMAYSFVTIDEFEDRVSYILKGDVDIIISTFTITKDRLKLLDFSIPYYYTKPAILVRSNSDINSIADISEKVCTVVKGTVSEKTANVFLPNSKVLSKKNRNLCLMLLDLGIAEAYIEDCAIIESLSNFKTDKYKIIKIDNIEYQYGIAIKQNSNGLLDKINDFIYQASFSPDSLGNSELVKLCKKYDLSPSVNEVTSSLSRIEIESKIKELKSDIDFLNKMLK
ncbi:MAG: amino acid ABC transporter substrate-binding protein [Candidatus Delongbacteria bacterium]|nr:amino acid ABC transporter substrate-binding protein [Candidatus Delongbacteria bacterium]MBN2835718.1 amino acid ABC transporter substrate-binding protein [Candidatus Delongbacteria bacterium]